MPEITCRVCGKKFYFRSQLPGGRGRCPDCRAAGRRPAPLWPALLVLALALAALLVWWLVH